MSPKKKKDKAQITREKVEAFLKERSILIADTSSSCRGSIARVMKGLGAVGSNVEMVPNFAQADEIIEKKKPDVVICDYFLGDKCGLELFLHHRDVDNPNQLFIIVASTASQTSVAEAAEEDVDAFVLKPFTMDTLEEYIEKAIARKVHPDDYEKKIREGRDQLNQSNEDAAIEAFETAKALSEAPSLAHYYTGNISAVKKDYAAAVEDYKKGINYINIHYKCLTGLYDSQRKLNDYEDAYKSAKKISEHFPVAPQRLDDFIQLAIKTSNFEDVERYYEIFTNLMYRTDRLVKCVGAALFISGKKCLNQDHPDLAKSLFLKAVTASRTDPVVVNRVISELIAHEEIEMAEKIFKKFKPEHQADLHYIASDCLIRAKVDNPEVVITKVRKLILEKKHHPDLYKAIIMCAVKTDRQEMVEGFLEDANAQFPEYREDFLALIGEVDFEEEEYDEEEYEEEDCA